MFSHYCSEPEVPNTVLCNGPDCLLCRIGKKRDERILLPVYLPIDERVAVLPVSPSLRPHALLPQLAPALTKKKPTVVFVSRRADWTYSVTVLDLPDDMDAGEELIQKFLADYEAEKVDLTSVYQRFEPDQLGMVPSIAQMAKLKGIKI